MRRDPDNGVIAGVCSGIASRVGVDPLLVRLGFLALTFAGGLGVVAYVVAWVLMSAGADAAGTRLQLRTGRAEIEVASGIGLLALSVLLTFRATGLWFSDVVVWPITLVAAGGALLWRGSGQGAPGEGRHARRALAAGGPAAGPRIGLGVVLVIGAGIVFLQATGALTAARDVTLAAAAVVVVAAVIVGPYVVRLRTERIRTAERAEMAAHLHDSVLQTLALVQRRASDPRAVATIARRQERELRAWLEGRAARGDDRRLGSALAAAAEEVENAHGAPVELVTVGDAPLDERGEALVAATREAMANAARFAGHADVYAEAEDGVVEVWVRDRGPGFDPEAIPADRRGVRESIVARMARHGGSAAIHSGPDGTEVELRIGAAR